MQHININKNVSLGYFRAPSADLTLNDFFSGFIGNLSDRMRSDSTVASHSYMYRMFIGPIAGHIQIGELTPIVGDAIALSAGSASGSNPLRAIVTFRQMLRYVSRLGLRLPFDWRDIDIPKYVSKRRVEAFSVNEIRSIRGFLSRQHARDTRHTSIEALGKHAIAMSRMRAMFELNIHSGLRISECVGIRKSDVDWDRCEIRIVNSKTHEPEIVYFNGAKEAILKYLSDRDDSCEFLFVTHDGRGMTRNGLKSHFKSIKRLIEEDGCQVKPFVSHTLRKTFGTHLVRNVTDIKAAQRLMRHRSIRTTLNHYVALDQERCGEIHKDIMNRL